MLPSTLIMKIALAHGVICSTNGSCWTCVILHSYNKNIMPLMCLAPSVEGRREEGDCMNAHAVICGLYHATDVQLAMGVGVGWGSWVN